MRGLTYAKEFPLLPGGREMAIRMVMEHREEYACQWAAVASKLEMTAETLRGWVRRAQIDGGLAPGLATDLRKCLKELGRELRDLHHANATTSSRNSWE